MNREVAIIHYNTPELTEAAILSLRKHGGKDYHVTVFDNSEPITDERTGRVFKARPFIKQMDGVTVIDNTEGQVINFDEELAKFPHKCKTVGVWANYYGSCKHMMTIERLWDILPDGFLLMDSDVLIKADVDFMFEEDHLCVGHIQSGDKNNHFGIDRLVPFLCYINVPLCRKWGIKYFDPKRNRGLASEDDKDPNNWYDTGASFLDEVRKCPAKGRRIDIRPLMEHLQAGSWKNVVSQEAHRWLLKHADLWRADEYQRPNTDAVAICAIGRLENRYAKEFVEHHLKQGVQKIIIYDNNHEGEETFDTVLKSYIAKGQVEIVEWRNLAHTQVIAYRHCYEHYGDKFAWIGFFDFDEHLCVTDGRKIGDVLKDIKADVVTLNWQCYGDNGLVKADKKKLATRFKTPLPEDMNINYAFAENNHVKAFVRGGLPWTTWPSPHCPRVLGTYAHINGTPSIYGPFHDADYSVAYLKHYVTKTIEEWMTIKLKRGEGCSEKNTENIRKNAVEIFFKYNERTSEKEAWLREHGFIK